MTRMHYDIAMPNVQIRNVPEDVHRALKSKAALAGRSLNDYLLSQLEVIARTESIPEWMARLREREPYEGPSSAALIREDRDRR